MVWKSREWTLLTYAQWWQYVQCWYEVDTILFEDMSELNWMRKTIGLGSDTHSVRRNIYNFFITIVLEALFIYCCSDRRRDTPIIKVPYWLQLSTYSSSSGRLVIIVDVVLGLVRRRNAFRVVVHGGSEWRVTGLATATTTNTNKNLTVGQRLRRQDDY